MALMNRIYGAILVWLSLEVFFLNIIPNEFLAFAVVAMGVLILVTPVQKNPYGQRSGFQMARTYVFGIAIVLMGLSSIFGWDGTIVWFSYLSINSTVGGIILLAVGILEFFSTSALGKTPITRI